MTSDPNTAQARALLKALWDQVTSISAVLEGVEARQGRSVSGGVVDRSRQSELRRDLYEAHRLIDGIHLRFPDTRIHPVRQVSPPGYLRRAHR